MNTPSTSLDTVQPVGGYQVELLLTTREPIQWTALGETLAKLDSEARLETTATGVTVSFAGTEPSIIVVEHDENRHSDGEAVDAAASQTWDWPHATHALGHAMDSLIIREGSSTPISDRYERLRRLSIVLRAVIEHADTAAIHWQPSQRLVDPKGFIESLAHGGTVTDHAVNVRLFNVPDGQPGEMLMDTLGLSYFGLPDLQCHFKGLEPGQIAPILLHYAEYLFEKGDVLKDDDLVRGIEAYDEWACHREESLAQPVRVVVDIRPDKHGATH